MDKQAMGDFNPTLPVSFLCMQKYGFQECAGTFSRARESACFSSSVRV